MRRLAEWASAIVIILTFALFGVALVTSGFTRNFLLEAAVFLVSMKLIISSYRISKRLERIEGLLNDSPERSADRQ